MWRLSRNEPESNEPGNQNVPVSKNMKKTSARADASKPQDSIKVLYPKPKILVVDVPTAMSDALAAKGFNITVGSFGKPYQVVKHSGFVPLIGEANLPNYTEQEIVI